MHDHLLFTLWDVEHGLSIWIRTPSGQNHWIDVGSNSTTDFSPAQRVRSHYGERSLDYLVVSHPDSDHINGLPELLSEFGNPEVFCRNFTLPDNVNHRFGQADYQRAYRNLNTAYNDLIGNGTNPIGPSVNGGVDVWTNFLRYEDAKDLNDSSVVCFYSYAGWLFICPGDIGPTGWRSFYSYYKSEIDEMVRNSAVRLLVAQHHGRSSGYSPDMMDALKPDLVLVSDKRGLQPTDSRYYTKPSGVTVDGELIRCLSTKSVGRIQLQIPPSGTWRINYWKTS